MDKKRFLKTAVRYVLQGGQLDSNALSWPALKQRLLDDDFCSADELEEQRNYIIELYLGGIKESLQGQPPDTGAASKSSTTGETVSKRISHNDSGFHGSPDVNAVDSDSDSVQVSVSANETRVPIVDETRNDETTLFNVFVSESWQGAGLKYGKGEDSYVRTRWAEMYGLTIDGNVMLGWKFNNKTQTQRTVFIPSSDLEILDCDFLLGTKYLDPLWNRTLDASNERLQSPDPCQNQPGQFMSLPESIPSSQSTAAWLTKTTPNIPFITSMILETEYQLRISGVHEGVVSSPPQCPRGMVTEAEQHRNKRRNAPHDLDPHTNSSKRPRRTRVEVRHA